MINPERIRMNGARLLVKEEKLEDTLHSGIVIQGRSKQQTNIGTVLKVGDGAMLENGTKVPVAIKPGEVVIYSSFSGSPIKERSEDPDEFIILNERDVLCIVEPEEE